MPISSTVGNPTTFVNEPTSDEMKRAPAMPWAAYAPALSSHSPVSRYASIASSPTGRKTSRLGRRAEHRVR